MHNREHIGSLSRRICRYVRDGDAGEYNSHHDIDYHHSINGGFHLFRITACSRCLTHCYESVKNAGTKKDCSNNGQQIHPILVFDSLTWRLRACSLRVCSLRLRA